MFSIQLPDYRTACRLWAEVCADGGDLWGVTYRDCLDLGASPDDAWRRAWDAANAREAYLRAQPGFVHAEKRLAAAWAALDEVERADNATVDDLGRVQYAYDLALHDLRKLEADLPAVPAAFWGIDSWGVGPIRVLLGDTACEVRVVMYDGDPTPEAYALAARIAATAAALVQSV